MMFRRWSKEAIRKAEFQLMECQVGTWQEKIAAALNEAIAQAEYEENKERRERLAKKLSELEPVS